MSQSDRGANSTGPFLLAAAAVACLMALFEALKQLLFPGVTIWRSHIATISFTTVLATVAAYLIAQRLARLNEVLRKQLIEGVRIAEVLRQSEENYRGLVNAIDGIVWEADAQTFRFSLVSASAERILGYAPADWLQDPAFWRNHIHPDDQDWAINLRVAGTQQLQDHGFRYRMIAANGRTVWVHDRVTVLAKDGSAFRLRGIMVDVSEQARAEEELKASEANFRSLVENSPYGICRTKAPGDRFVSVNPALVRMLGYSSEKDVLALSLSRDVYVSAQDREESLAADQPPKEFEFESEWKRKDGTHIRIRAVGRAVLDASGQDNFFESIIEEITDRYRLEQQLRQAQKLEAIGLLAGGVAHDFNNLLGVILGHSELLESRLDPESPLRVHCQAVRRAGEHAASLTGQLLAFGRRQVLQVSVLDLNQVLDGMETLLRHLLRENVELVVQHAPGLGRIRADQVLIEQVILNLAANARDAMPQGGKLTVGTANAELGDDYIHRHSDASTGSYVMLYVSDTGNGMDEETQSRIFEPFFTTKGLGRGTGLGLATVYGIVKQSGGHIWVYSEPRRGTTFKVYLPRVMEPVEENALPAATESIASGSETVLLVEDSGPLREVTRQFLENYGYTVLEASGVRAALLEADRHKDEISLLVTDVILPDGNGHILAGQLVELKPELKVLFISGHTDNTILEQGGLETGSAFLQKPYTCKALVRKVREVLDGSKESPA